MKYIDDSLQNAGALLSSLAKPDFAKQWFQWLEWITLTAAMWTIADKSDAAVIRLVAFISTLILFFKAWYALEQLADEFLPHPKTLPRWIFYILSFLVGL